MSKRLPFAFAILLILSPAAARAQNSSGKLRLGIVGLDHDHVWGILKDIAEVPQADLVAIADPHPELIQKAKRVVPASVKFYSDYVAMLDEAKPQAVIITTETDHHLRIVRECAKRHIHVEMEKPMATTAAAAREMERLAEAARIKLMVNYFDFWLPSYQQLYTEVRAGKIGPIQKLIAEFGHQGPREIGVSTEFAAWLYDPVKNGGGALMDFGCYGAALALWLDGRPTKVFARSLKLKVSEHNAVEDDAVIMLEYPKATVILEPSWDWPFSVSRTRVFGPRGSLTATRDALFFRAANSRFSAAHPDGEAAELPPQSLDESNPMAYFVEHIQRNLPIGGFLTGRVNLEVNEILDTAKESIRTGHAVPLPKQ